MCFRKTKRPRGASREVGVERWAGSQERARSQEHWGAWEVLNDHHFLSLSLLPFWLSSSLKLSAGHILDGDPGWLSPLESEW